MSRGYFFSIEGLDGCGKSTQVKLLIDYFTREGMTALALREPGGCPISEEIREVLLNKKNTEMNSKTELLLYMAARAQLVHEIVEPALKAGTHIVADRFGWATYAYQGYGREMDLDSIQWLRDFSCDDTWPNHSFLLDISLDKMQERLSGSNKDRMELEKRSFFERTRSGYIEIAENNSDKITVIDGENPVGIIHEQIISEIDRIIGKKVVN